MKLSVSKDGKYIAEYDFPKELEIHQILIGRSQGSHILIDDPQISRTHIELTWDESSQKWFAENKAMIGFMLYNGKPEEKVELAPGDILEIGSYSIGIKETNVLNQVLNEEKEISHSEKPEELDGGEREDTEDLETTEVYLDGDDTELDKTDVFNEDEEFSSGEPSDFEGSEETFSDDDGFSDNDDFSDNNDFGFDSEDDSDKTGVFTHFANFYLKLFGENIPYDRFKIPEGEIYIGRDPDKCQILLNEEDVSSVHAVIRKNNMTCILEDLNSSNGTILNGERVNKRDLVNGDEFIIGSTSFSVEVVSELFKEEKERLMPVEPNQVIDVEEIVEDEVSFGEAAEMESPIEESSGLKSFLKDPKKRKRLLIYAVVIMALWFFLDEEEEPKPKIKPKAKEEKTKAQSQPDSQEGQKREAKKFTKEQLEALESFYQVGVRFFEEDNFSQARDEFTRVSSIDPNYKSVSTYLRATDKALIELNKAEEKKREEEKRRILEAEIKDLLEKAKVAFRDKNIELTEFYIGKISEKDPENLEIPYLRVEVDAYLKKKKEEEEEKRRKEEERNRMLSLLKPGEDFYYRKEWYKAILKLEDYIRRKDIDSDLIEKAVSMLDLARRNLRDMVDPMLGEARSLRDGQDLKGAYEIYSKIYEVDQSNIEALNEMEEIRVKLERRSMKVYREAIIAESLSLFDEAKEKLQEVQQISPSDSFYYKKATEKLRKYLD